MSQKKYVSLSKLSTFLDNLYKKFAVIGHDHELSDIADYAVDSQLSATSTNPVQNKVLDAEFEAISVAMNALESVVDSAHTLAENVVHVGPTEPTDPNVKVWINTSEEGTGVIPVLPRVATVTLAANAWSGSVEPYSQSVNVATVTTSSKIDLQPTAAQIVALQNAETSLMIENNGGLLTCYAIGNKPAVDYTMQVLIQEVAYV